MKAILSLAVALAGFLPILPAQALTADGLTYTLSAFATPDPEVATFALEISGINGPSDQEGGRYGVFAIAFNDPTGIATITAVPAGFELVPGGLSSGSSGGGCNGHGNFICVQNTQPIAQSSLAANSTLSFDFTVDFSGISALAAVDYEDDFKISWDGSKSKGYQYDPQNPTDAGNFKSGYDHVSHDLLPPPAAAPEIDPGSATAALTFLAGGLAMLGGRRRKS